MKKILLALVFSSALVAQRSDTILQQVVVNSQVATITTAPFQNIGQYSHQLTTTMSNAPGKTCPVQSGFFNLLQGSFDGINFTRLIQNSTVDTATSGAESKIVQGYGSYSFIRAQIGGYDNVNCLINSYYAGTVFPNSVQTLPVTQQITPFGPYQVGLTVAATPTPITHVIPAGNTSDAVFWSGFNLYCAVAGQTITIVDNISSVFYTWTATPANFQINLPYTGVAYGISIGPGSFTLTTSGVCSYSSTYSVQ